MPTSLPLPAQPAATKYLLIASVVFVCLFSTCILQRNAINLFILSLSRARAIYFSIFHIHSCCSFLLLLEREGVAASFSH